MIEKHFLFIDETTTVGMKFDFAERVLTLGGLARFRRAMTDILDGLLPDTDYEIQPVQKNKCKIVSKIKEKEYLAFLKALPEQGIVTQQTQSLQRLMR